ncbi:hypothetical protein PR003_g279 [Phytophthora rubi]|uniref:Vta1/callose synthase N-terminal domain-containing protein n=1 Tax=Phytophthora rubi TaxID=129364 RepID=A0A6A3NS49_9STRA|nr:hypothetical protein PR002_g500 [Phytophthora rubi]KAE9052784.1 hypothetical protein PR001_g180 [Phytophthora rubi]KAE9360328.1 hypothetical protein PR003_g279 [Phytophthora rubi]
MADPQPVKVPPTFKTLLPFIRRAEELDRDTSRPESKLIAYFCRQYAMELGIKLRENDASNDATDYLLSLMDRLEEEKNKLPDFTQEEGKEICEDFAIEIFSKADDEDRAGMANKSTARTFYAAGTFFDILNQFGDVSEDVVEKRRYCKFKAATILKAIKEGKDPTPGPPEGLDLKSAEDGTDDAPSTTSIPSAPQPPTQNLPVSSPQPPQPSELAFKQETHFPSVTESARSAGAMSASELDSTWHGPTPSHSAPAAPTAPPAPVYSAPKAPPAPPAPTPAYQPPPAPTQFPSAPTPSYQPPSGYTPQSTPSRPRNTPISQNEINDAIEYAKFAVAALKVKDMKLAEERLEMALRNIRGS